MRKVFLTVSAAALLFLSVSRCGIAKDVGYYLQLGESLPAGEYRMKSGVIKVSRKNSPLDGFELIVPPGAYESTQVFRIIYTRVRKSKVPDHVLSPLITVTGPGAIAAVPLIVKIPCKVPGESDAMIFFYDDKEKFTQGLPPGPPHPGYVTGLTRVLKDMVVVGQNKGRSGNK